MLINDVVSHLEMTGRDQLIPGTVRGDISLRRCNCDQWEVLHQTFVRVGNGVGKSFKERRIPP